MAGSPLEKAVGVVRLIVSADGTQIDEKFRVESVTIDSELNKVPHASISIIDGNVPKQNMPASNESCFWPGAKIKIECGYGTSAETLFNGLIVKQATQISGKSSSIQLTCKEEILKMNSYETATTFENMTESDIMKKLISENGSKVKDIEETEDDSEKLQFQISNWKYLLSLASKNALLVNVEPSGVSAQPIKPQDDPVITLTYGVDIESFSSDIDATNQISEVEAIGWDLNTQDLIVASGELPENIEQGTLKRDKLSKVLNPKKQTIYSNVPITKEELQGIADDYLQKSELKRLTGSVSFQGTNDVIPGKIIELKGVGDLYTGNAFVNSVSHSIGSGNWKTTVKFGAPDTEVKQFKGASSVSKEASNSVKGLQIGKVTKLDADPEGEFKIQVMLPFVNGDSNTIWARLSGFYASNSFGTFFIPEIDDEVIIGFFNNNPSHPVILGSMYSSKLPPNQELTAENNIKSILTRSKLKIEFDEEKKAITLETPAGNKVVLSDDAKSILLEDQNSNKIELGTGGITIESPKDISINAKGSIVQEATTGLEITSKASLKVKGLSVEQSADTTMTVKGTASSEFSASGQTTVKGAMVMIN
jgi:phage protein D